MNRSIRHFCQLIVVGIVVSVVVFLPAVVQARISLSQLLAQINALQTQVDALEANKADQSDIDALQTQINALQTQVDALGGGLVVLDANGTEVGKFISLDSPFGPAIVSFTVNGQLFALSVEKNLIGGTQVLFEDANCQTTPFIKVSSFLDTRAILPPAGVAPPGHTVYLADLSAPRQFINPQSVFFAGPGGCGMAGGNNIEAFQLLPVLQLDDFFTAPFRVE